DNDGAGPEGLSVFAGGAFTSSGGKPASDIGRYMLSGVPAAITLQPTPVVAPIGSAVEFRVHASGTGPLTFQWRKNSANLLNDAHVPGARGPVPPIDPISAADVASYDAVVPGPCGGTTTTAATLSLPSTCGSADFNCDGDLGTDADIASFFA